MLTMNTKVDGVIESVTKNSMVRALNTSGTDVGTIVKEYYVYEYQRWWVRKKWVPTHYSDEYRRAVLEAKKCPPAGWTWLGPWQVAKC
jgi:hypothetical protein